MGYEGHLMMEPADRKATKVADAMALLLAAHADVGGDVVSGGGTGTFDLNTWCTEIQAGSYTLMDTAYAALGLPFEQALSSLVDGHLGATPTAGAVGDCGLKSLGMDHGDPSIDGAEVLVLLGRAHHVRAGRRGRDAAVGDRVRVWPAHVDPTVAYHERFHVVDVEVRSSTSGRSTCAAGEALYGGWLDRLRVRSSRGEQ